MQDFDVGKRFHKVEDTRRLNGSYVFHNGRIKYLKMVGGGYMAHLYDPGAAAPDPVMIDVQEDPALDLTSPELGYMNYGGDARFVYRRPQRQWHYLHEGNCANFSLLNLRDRGMEGMLFYTQSFKDMIEGKYTSYKKIMKIVKGEPFLHAAAFDRYFAIRSDKTTTQLFYRDVPIATFNKDEELWKLDPKFDYPTLTERLERHGLDFGV